MLPNSSDPSDDYGLPFTDLLPVENEETDLSATSYEALAVDVAAMTRTCPKAWARFSIDTDVATLEDWDSVWGNAEASKPSCTDQGGGEFLVTFPSSVQDINPTTDRRESRSLVIRTASAQVHSTAPTATVILHTIDLTSANTITVFFYDEGTGPVDPAGFTVWIY